MANLVYQITATDVTFGSEGGDTVAWSTESISSGAGRQSALYDQGADNTARTYWWRYRFYTQLQATTPVLGQRVRLFLKTSDGTHPDNDDGVGDAAVSAEDKLRNLTPLNSPIVDEVAANIEIVSKGVIFIPHRHFGLVLWNDSGASITTDVAETKAIFSQFSDQIQ